MANAFHRQIGWSCVAWPPNHMKDATNETRSLVVDRRCVAIGATSAAIAETSMDRDPMEKGSMEKGSKHKDSMSKGAKHKDSMHRDSMGKDAMEKPFM
jgi:pentapeptide MXKDX repeat protein